MHADTAIFYFNNVIGARIDSDSMREPVDLRPSPRFKRKIMIDNGVRDAMVPIVVIFYKESLNILVNTLLAGCFHCRAP